MLPTRACPRRGRSQHFPGLWLKGNIAYHWQTSLCVTFSLFSFFPNPCPHSLLFSLLTFWPTGLSICLPAGGKRRTGSSRGGDEALQWSNFLQKGRSLHLVRGRPDPAWAGPTRRRVQRLAWSHARTHRRHSALTSNHSTKIPHIASHWSSLPCCVCLWRRRLH